MLHPEYLRSVAARSTGDALLAVRIETWDENRLLSQGKYVTFQFQAALVASDGEVLWSGTISGQAKAGGAGAAGLSRDARARSCAEAALGEMLEHLPGPHPLIPVADPSLRAPRSGATAAVAATQVRAAP